jgi:hypothetical protein
MMRRRYPGACFRLGVKKMPCTERASDAGLSDCRSIEHDHDDSDDDDGRDQRERTINFRAVRCGGRFERRHDLTSLSSTTFEACLVLQRSIPDGQPFFEEGRLFSAPRFAALRAASRALPQARPPPARYDCGDQRRFRLPASRPSYFSPMSYWGGLSSPPSQPRTLDSTGSLDADEVWIRPHFWHSNVRRSQPEGPPSIPKRSIRG